MIGPGPGGAAAAAVVTLIVVQAEIQNSGLQAKQVGNVALDRQRQNGGAIKGIAHGGVGGVQRRRLAADTDSGGRGFHRQGKIERQRLIDQQLNRLRLLSKSRGLDRNGVLPGRKLLKLIRSVVAGNVSFRKTIFAVDQ